jgi:predicted O-methyltransferase YrrM
MNIAPQVFENNIYEKLTDRDLQYSEMPDVERRFVNGLVRYFRPRRLLEIGVARGGGSVVLLNAIADMRGRTLVSIDAMTEYYADSGFEVGFSALEKYRDRMLGAVTPDENKCEVSYSETGKCSDGEKQWQLITGKDPAEVMDVIGTARKFDFAVLDSAHIHPVESLNFLTFLPYLADDAIVVIQDIGFWAWQIRSLRESFYQGLHRFPFLSFANKLLFDTVSADKITLPINEYPERMPFSNIGAFQINRDTWRYLDNVFSMLAFPWGIVPPRIGAVAKFIHKHYEQKHIDMFDRALAMNSILASNQYTSFAGMEKANVRQGRKIVYYGAGRYLQGILFRLAQEKRNRPDDVWFWPDEIWDINAKNIVELAGIPVKTPCFDNTSTGENTMMVISMDRQFHGAVVDEVARRLKENGFPEIYYLDDLVYNE